MSVWHTGVDRNPVGIMDAVDQTEALGPFAGPGQWHDPDMLIVGLKNGTGPQSRHQNEVTSLNATEQRTQMSLYCLLAAPLIIGADI
jgi:alpha-galactosidase